MGHRSAPESFYASALRSDDLAEVFQWMTDCQQASDKSASPKNRLDREVGNAALTYRQPPTPGDESCLFHAMNDQLIRLGRENNRRNLFQMRKTIRVLNTRCFSER